MRHAMLRMLGLGMAMASWAGCGGAQTPNEPEDPRLVVLEGELGNELVGAAQPTPILSRPRVTARPLRDAARPPINLALVIDTWGSMQGAPIADARNASLALLETLRPEDRLAVVAFSSETEGAPRLDGVVGPPVQTASGATRVLRGDLSEGEQRELIVRLHVEPRREGATVELMDAVLTFSDAVRNAGTLERRVFFGARATADPGELERGPNVEVERAAIRMQAEHRARPRARAPRRDRGRAAHPRSGRRRGVERRGRRRGGAPAGRSDARPARGAAGGRRSRRDGRSTRRPAAVVRSSHGSAMGVLQGTSP